MVLGIYARGEDEDEEKAVEGAAELNAFDGQGMNDAMQVSEARRLQELLKEADPDDPDSVKEVHREITLYAALLRPPIRGARNVRYLVSGHGLGLQQQLAFELLEFLYTPTREHLERMHDAIKYCADALELDNLRSPTQALTTIEGILGDDTVSVISDVVQAQPQTVNGWLLGKHPNSRNSSVICNLARAFFVLKRDGGLTRDEIVNWFESPHAELGGNSPRDYLSNGHSYYGNEVFRLARDDAGVDLAGQW